MSERVSIIIPAFNQLDFCRQCVDSIRANTAEAYRLVLVDNGSTDGVGAYFDEVGRAVPGTLVVHAAENTGFAGGVNLGLKACAEEEGRGHVLLLNSDTLTPVGWLGRLLGALDEDGRVGLVGPMSNYASGGQQIDGLDFDSMEGINAYAAALGEEKAGCLRDVARLIGFCLLIRYEAWQALGGFDEGYGIGNFEDDDYCLRAVRAGYRVCIAEDAFVFHYGSRTFVGMGITDEAWQDLIARNEARFREKWNAAPSERSDEAQQSKRLNEAAAEAFGRGDRVEAARLLKEAVERFPLLEKNYNDLGVVLWELGEGDRAVACFEQAVRLNPEYVEGRTNLEEACRALGRGPGI